MSDTATLDFLEIDAGVELNALVADRVMSDHRLAEPIVVGVPGHEYKLRWKAHGELWQEACPYSTDPTFALRVLAHFDCGWWIERLRNGSYEVRIYRPENEHRNDYGTAIASDLPLAICRAALTSVHLYGRVSQPSSASPGPP